jgi:UDP-GlcNAc:undecaprenyl-phosphate GlcNAc-1-phosphate transferase
MELSPINYLLLFVTSCGLVGLLTALMRKIAIARGVFDYPNSAHKSHKKPIPYLGGMAIIITVDLLTLVGIFLLGTDSKTKLSVLAIIIPATLMGFMGLFDDLRKLSPLSRLIAQTITGIFTAISVTITNTIGNPFSNQLMNYFVTILWIVAITNATNFFDNIDGGVAGFIMISCSALFFLSIQNQQDYIAALSILLTGSAVGFLFWNFNPAKIYLGDAGALYLGVLFSATLVRFEPNTTNRIAGYAIPILLVAVLIMDTLIAVASRVLRGVSPFKGGRDHLSHRLLVQGISQKKSVVYLWTLCIFFALGAILVSSVPQEIQLGAILLYVFLWTLILTWFARKSSILIAKGFVT